MQEFITVHNIMHSKMLGTFLERLPRLTSLEFCPIAAMVCKRHQTARM